MSTRGWRSWLDKSGPAIVPGRPDESLLIQTIMQADPKKKMPLAGNKLA